MKKRILCLMMSFILAGLSMTSFTAIGADETTYALSQSSQNSKELLSAIDIDLSHCDDTVATVSRAEFIYVLMQLVGCGGEGGGSVPFDDVAASDYFSSALSYALGLNVVSAASSFYPLREVTVYEACKMSIAALGGAYLANVKGGYPYGYYRIADEMNLLDAITSSGDEFLSREEFYHFMQAFVNAYVYEPEKIGNDSLVISNARTVLEVYHDAYTVSGIITANEFSALYDPNVNLGEGFAEIDHTVYKTLASAKLGACVTAYVKNDRNYDTVIFFDYSETTSVVVDTSAVLSVGSSSVEYEIDGVQKTLHLASKPAFIYNGKADIKFIASHLNKVDGVITFVDNDRNGRYDVVEVAESTLIYVRSINSDENYITGFNNELIDLEDKEDEKCFVTVDGVATSLSKMPAGAIASCSTSKDGLLNNISVSTVSVSGTVDGFNSGNNLIYIDGTAYEYGKYFVANYLSRTELGSSGTFLLSDRGVIEAFVKESKGAMQFGYFINIKQREGLDAGISVKLCTADDTVAVFDIADKVVINGSASTQKADALSLLTKDGKAVQQIIRYSLNKDGAINCIDTKGETNGLMTGDEPENNNLTRYLFPDTGSLIYNTSTGIVFPFFGLSDDAVAFIVGNNADVEDEKRFRAYKAKSYYNSGNNNVSANTEIWNVTADNMASALVISANVLAPAVSRYTPAGLIYSVSKATVGDGEICLKVVAVTKEEFKTYYIKDESVLTQISAEATFDNPVIEPGDVLRISAAADGTIGSLRLDYDYVAGSDGTIDNEETSHNSLCIYYHGTLYSYSSGTITAVPSGTADITASSTRYIWKVTGNIPVFDTKTGDVTHVPVESLRTYTLFGSDCNKVLVRTQNGAVTYIFAYK